MKRLITVNKVRVPGIHMTCPQVMIHISNHRESIICIVDKMYDTIIHVGLTVDNNQGMYI